MKSKKNKSNKNLKSENDIKDNKNYLITNGKIVAILGNSTFKVLCDNDKFVISRIATEFRNRRQKGRSSKIIEGSKVKLKISLNDLHQGQIINFFKEKEEEENPSPGNNN